MHMLCWTSTQYWNGSPKRFKVSSPYGIGHMNANQVGAQTIVGRCWERSRAMELWQMDVVGGVRLVDGSEAKIITGVDDHSRFCVSAYVVARATARPTCDALGLAMRTDGVPDQILTDNGKVFTGRFGQRTGEVLFHRICRENGIRHLLTAPRSPTTTGKVERFHKTPICMELS